MSIGQAQYRDALDRILEDYSTQIPAAVKVIIEEALTGECPACRQDKPLYRVASPYIRGFYSRLCYWCLRDETERCD